jgi:hypothetical protein
MSTKSDYTIEEWKTILAAPYYAAMLIIVSDMNVAYFKEIAALAKAVMASAEGSQSELVQEVARDFSNKENQEEIKPELEKLKSQKDPVALKGSMVEYIVNTADLVASKSPEDGDSYRRWHVYLAEKTAEGSKEGGFLGIGAVRVSDKEKAALDELAQALEVTSSE